MFLIRITSFIALLFCQTLAYSQTKAPRFYSETILSEKADSLERCFGVNKLLYEKFELATLVALSFYPELAETQIIFQSKKISSTMAARPKGLNVLRRRGKRVYLVLINDFPDAEITADSIPFNAQVGVIGHELAHIAEYETKSTFGIIAIALRYGSKKYKQKFEKATDQRTIDHGLGWQCYDFAVFVAHYPYASKKYIDYKKKTYMQAKEIEEAKD